MVADMGDVGLLRNGPSDSLTYFYEPEPHRLKRVPDNVPAANYSEDIDSQPGNNHTYDSISNPCREQGRTVISDLSEGISNILSSSPHRAP